ERRGGDTAPLQGRAQPARAREPRDEALLRAGVPAQRAARVRGDGQRGAAGVRVVRHARVRSALQLLPPGSRGRGEALAGARGRPGGGRTADAGARGPLRDREPVVLLDRKERMYLRVLRQGGRMSIRGNAILCDALIGQAEGCTVETAAGEPLVVLRPTYAQLIPNLPRRAQPIYPKDVGPILLCGDIGPGDHVVEVGAGPGAVTIALLQAVGPTLR